MSLRQRPSELKRPPNPNFSTKLAFELIQFRALSGKNTLLCSHDSREVQDLAALDIFSKVLQTF